MDRYPREQYHDNWYLNEQPSDHRPGLNDRECDNSAWHPIHEHPHSRRRAYPDEYRREHELERTHEYRHHAENLNLQQQEESSIQEDRLTNRFRETENHSRRFGYDRQHFYLSRDKEYSEINQLRNYQDIERYTYREERKCHREWSRSENDDRETLLTALSSDDRGDLYIQQQEERLTQEDRLNKIFRETESHSSFRYDSQPLYQTCVKGYSGIEQERNYQTRPYEDRRDIELYTPRKNWERPSEWRRSESGYRESLLRARSSDDRGRVDRRRYEGARHSGWTDRRKHTGKQWYKRDNRKLVQTGRRNVKFNRTQSLKSTSCVSDTKPCTISSSKEIHCDMNLADEKVLPVIDVNLQKKYDAENTKRTSGGNTANYCAVFSDAETQYIDQDVQSLDMPFHNLLTGEVKEMKKESDSYFPSALLPVIAITGKKRNRNEKPDKCCDAENQVSSSQKKIKRRINNSDGKDGAIEDYNDVNDSEDNKVSCSSLDLFSDSEDINSKHPKHTNTEVYDFDAAANDSKIETMKYEIKSEPDSLVNGYTQEPDIVWVSDDEDNTVIMSFSQPVINLQGSVAIKSEENDSDYDLFGPDNSSNSDFDHETILGFPLNAKSSFDKEHESAFSLDRNEVMEVGVLEDVDSSAGYSSNNDIIPPYLNDDDSELHVDTDTELDNVMSTHEVKMPGDKVKKNHFVETETLSPVNDKYMQETQKGGELEQADKFMKEKYELYQLAQKPIEITIKPDKLTKKDVTLTQAPMTSTFGNCDALIQAGTSAKREADGEEGGLYLPHLSFPLLNETEPGVSKKKTATSYSTHLSSAKSVSTSARRHSETGYLMDKLMNRSQQTRRAGDQKQVKTQTPTTNKKSLHGRTPLQLLDSQQRAMGPAPPLVQTPTEHLPATLIDKPKVIVWEDFLKVILKWSPKWLNEADQEENKGQPPPVAGDWLGQPKPQIFSLIERYFSYEEYSAKFMLPLLLYETWEQCRKDYLLKKRNILTYHLIINSIEDYSEPLQSFTMLGFTSRAARRKGEMISRNDLVWLSLSVKMPRRASSHSPEVFEAMGVVKNVSYIKESAVIESLSKEYEQLAAARSGDTIVQSISIRLRNRNRKMTPVKTDIHQLRVVSSLVTSERAVQALRKFPENPLWKHMLFPTCNNTYFHNNRPVAAPSKTYNPSQLQAINTARCMLREGGTNPQVSLIQGPAGTGKSHTIIGIIKDIVKDQKGHVRICLCTPSNTAVDELVRRLVQSNKTKDFCDQVKVIRLGRVPSIPDDLQDCSLETAVEQVWQEENIPAGVYGELESIDKKIQIHKDKKKTTKDNNKRAQFTAEIQMLERQKDVIKKQLRMPAGLATNMRYCLKALEQAHVVAGTLSSMADHNLRQLYRELTATKKGPLFHCVIIDEAHQGIELETLIPLQYGTAKLIMMGDSEQLAPIVLSQKCQECRFDMSLFKRLESYFQTSATQSPVLLLDTQYRMHPEIALHPNQYSYEGRIQNDSSLYCRPKYPLVPYLVFNIEGTQLFSQTSRPMHNPEEAIFTAALCEFVIKHGKVRPSAIGIIAHYSKQKMDIERELRKRRLIHVEVSTVNGLLGQEREVIIISCFRFVGNRNKITVAITRAKHAMYIIGNLDCFKGNREWRALIENAEERNVVVPVTERNLQTALEKCLTK